MINPRITREAYPMNRLRSGNAAPSRPEISRYASCSRVVAPSVTPPPRRASSRFAMRCSSSYSVVKSASAAMLSPCSAEARSVVIAADTTGTLHPHAERQPVFPGNADSEIGGESLMKRDEFIAQRRAPPVVETVGERPRRAVAARERVPRCQRVRLAVERDGLFHAQLKCPSEQLTNACGVAPFER